MNYHDKKSSLIKYLLILLLFFGIGIFMLITPGCFTDEESSGTCYSIGGYNSDLCYEGWDESECSDYNSMGVNGASSWNFTSASCSDLGFTGCSDGSYVDSSYWCKK